MSKRSRRRVPVKPPWEKVPFTVHMLSAPPLSDAEIIRRGTEDRPDLIGKTLYEIKRALGIPILSEPTPDIVVRALGVIPEQQLYAMLRLESLGAIDAARVRIESAKMSARLWAEDVGKWRTSSQQLRAAATAVRAVAESELARILRTDSEPDPDATVRALETYARDAERLEHLMGGLHKVDTEAGARSSKFWKQIVRERATALVNRLGKERWSRGEIADLILASESAWDPPPVMLAPELRQSRPDETNDAHHTRLVERLRDLVDRRSNRRR